MNELEQLIDITKFLIIKPEQFQEIIAFLNCDLIPSDNEYMISYLFTNFFAYFLIIMVLVISMKIYKKLKRNTYNAKLI